MAPLRTNRHLFIRSSSLHRVVDVVPRLRGLWLMLTCELGLRGGCGSPGGADNCGGGVAICCTNISVGAAMAERSGWMITPFTSSSNNSSL